MRAPVVHVVADLAVGRPGATRPVAGSSALPPGEVDVAVYSNRRERTCRLSAADRARVR
jgi:hypothetical protein